LEGDNALDTVFLPARFNCVSPNGSRLPAYFRADASLTYIFGLAPGRHAHAGFSLVNLTGRHNSLNKYYRVYGEGELETVENLSPGIAPNFSSRVRF